MIIDEHSAVIDTDFINRVAEIRKPAAEVANLLNKFLSSVNLAAVIHPLVYTHEIIAPNETVEGFFKTGVIARPSFSDIFQGDSSKEEYYKFLVLELYKACFGAPPFDAAADILSCWKAKANLGEVHSIVMCLICGCSIFLSDDSDAKEVAKTARAHSIKPIQVHNRSEFADFAKAAASNISQKERKIFAHSR